MTSNLKWKVSKFDTYIKEIEVKKRYVNQITLGFLEGCQLEWQAKLDTAKRQLYFMTAPINTLGGVTRTDIERAKQVSIRTFVKVNSANKTLCLFHKDKQPSMHVYGDHYHCFTCNAHGDTIALVMALYQLKFSDAVKRIINSG